MIKYPNSNRQFGRKESHSKRGMKLENEINRANEYYLRENIAVIHKKPTPIKIVDVDYPSRDKAVITKAFFTTPSTTDYNGIYKGKYIDFEAKETNHQTLFPFKNIHNHQVEHIKKVIDHGGLAFLIVRFNSHNKTYLLKGEDLIRLINQNDRKSIAYETFEKIGYIIKDSYQPQFDYIKVINQILIDLEEDSHEKEN